MLNPSAIILFVVAYIALALAPLQQAVTFDIDGVIKIVERFGGLAMFGIYVWWREKRLASENDKGDTQLTKALADLKACQEARIKDTQEHGG